MRLFLFYFSFMLARPVASPGSVLIDSQVKMLILVSLFSNSLRAKNPGVRNFLWSELNLYTF